MKLRNSQHHEKRLAVAVSSALALMTAGAGAQVLDPNGPAVRDAYVGPVRSDKIQDALSGFKKTSEETQALFNNFAFGFHQW